MKNRQKGKKEKIEKTFYLFIYFIYLFIYLFASGSMPIGKYTYIGYMRAGIKKSNNVTHNTQNINLQHKQGHVLF
jgi:hypothetical protein